MKKLLIIIVAAGFLGGCQTGTRFSDFVAAATSNITNPVGNNELGAAIASYGLYDAAVIAYRSLPRCTITKNFSATYWCYKRSVLVEAQRLDKIANDKLNQAVDYQRANPTLNASNYIQLALEAVDTFKAFVDKNNIPVTGVN